MQLDKMTLISRECGTLPDRYWYQLNGKTAQENYQEQKAADEPEDENLHIISEVKVK